MDYKPQDLFLGVIDLFAILLPGMVLAVFVAQPALGLLEAQDITLSTAGKWLAYFVGAYALGHFLSLGGAYVLDVLFDKLRSLMKKWDRRERDLRPLGDRAGGLLTQLLPGTFDSKADSFVKWAVALVAVSKPDLVTHLDRKEADQKLFRSLTIVFLLLSVCFAVRGLHVGYSVLSIFLAAISFVRYCDQRKKYAELAYLYLFAVHRSGELKLPGDRGGGVGAKEAT